MMRRNVTRTDVQAAVDRLHELADEWTQTALSLIDIGNVERRDDYLIEGRRYYEHATSIRTILATLEEQ